MTDIVNVADDKPPVEGVPVQINGVEVLAHKGELVIDAAERNGVYIPRFCYHPRMKPVGMCRMCIVEVDTGRGPALQPSCMLEATPGMKVDTESEVTKKAQDGVLEFLLINHPLDCPVCDKGGECPLQDQTMAYGPGESRFVEEKRHKEKPIALSELVLMDRERCILCDRCTRFAGDVAGEQLISFIHRGNNTEVNTFPGQPFASYFSGNTVQICPVGALTSVPYRFKARPWDLEQRESTCTMCSVGCRISVQSSTNQVSRYLGVDIDPVNWGWLCDKGRYSYEWINSDERLRAPLVRTADGNQTEVVWGQALRAAGKVIRDAVSTRGAGSVAVLGGARLTNEEAYAWAKLAKGVIGTDNVDAQLGDGLPAELVLGLPPATIDEVCEPGGVVIVASGDVKEELPVLFLRLRHAVLNDGVTLIELSPQATGLTELAAVSLFHRPGEVAEAVRTLLHGSVPDGATVRDGGGVDLAAVIRANEIIRGGTPPKVILGRQSIAESPEFVADAASVFLAAVPGTRFLPALRRSNVRGALDLGLTPGFLPGRTTLEAGRSIFAGSWANVPAQRGLDATGILTAAAAGDIEVLVLLGADPLADFPDAELARKALANVPAIIAVDVLPNASVRQAHIVLPAAGFAEKGGTTTNLEGRISVLNQKVTAPGTARADWVIAAELAHQLDAELGFDTIEAIWDELTALAPAHRDLDRSALGGPVSGDGVIVPLPTRPGGTAGEHRAESVDDKPAEVVEAAQAEGESEGVDPQITESAEGAVPEGEPAEVTSEQSGESTAPVHPPHDPAIYVHRPTEPVSAPANDAYGLRLVAGRKLYDQGTLTQAAPHIAKLAPGTVLRINAHDFDRLGVAEGHRVRVKSNRGAHDAEIVRDPTLPRGAAGVWVDQPGLAINELIDATQRVTHLRLDSGADE